MSFTIFGLSFLIQAILHALGSDIFFGKNYRNSDAGRAYQRSLVFPLTFLGSGWVILGTLYFALYGGKDAKSFYVWLGAVTIIAFTMMAFNKYKFKKRIKSTK